MAEPFDYEAWKKSSAGINWNSWLNPNLSKAKASVFGSSIPDVFDEWTLNSAAASYLNSSWISTQEDYEKAFKVFKENPAEYYKSAVTAAAKNYGHMGSLESYFGGGQDKLAKNEYESIAKKAIEKGYLKPDEVVSLSQPAYEQAYIKQSGYNNPDLRSSNGLFGQTLGRITSNPISTLLFPVAAAGAMGAFSAAGAGGTDYLGSQALGDASTGAVGSGSTGFGINAGASGVGINAGTGSLLASTFEQPTLLENAAQAVTNPVIETPFDNPILEDIQIFDDGSTLQTFDDGSLLATDTSGAITSVQSPELTLLPETPVVDYSTPSVVDLQGNVVTEGTVLPESEFGISTTQPSGNFGEFNPNIGSGTAGSSGIGIDTGVAADIPYLGGASSLPAGSAGLTAEQLAAAGGAASDAAATSGLGYLGGADALPTGTAGLTTNVAADAGVSTSDVLRAANTINSLLATPEVPTQPTGNKSFVPKGNVNYDPLLNLLTMRASTPNLLSLLG